ncbi:hypothetical protein A5645_08590 [Mycobacterium asiaticum]|nr:hypothetical protein A5645_08590 [Mycobacterium asiaticum]
MCIISGAGHVGLPLALVLADRGFPAEVLDTNATQLKFVMAGDVPFIKNGAEELPERLPPCGWISVTRDSWGSLLALIWPAAG